MAKKLIIMRARGVLGASDNLPRPQLSLQLIFSARSAESSQPLQHDSMSPTHVMPHLAISASLAFAWLTVALATNQVPCNGAAARASSTHCKCLYAAWTEWEAINTTAVPREQCPSGHALTMERRQTATTGDCDDRIEVEIVCK